MQTSRFNYILVSGFCLLLHNMIMIITDKMGFSLLTAILISYALVMVSGYILHSGVSFRRSMTILAFGRYAMVMSLSIPLALVTVWLWHDVIDLPMFFAAPLATISALFLNFTMSRWAITGRRKAARHT